jgi:hypothetical protein
MQFAYEAGNPRRKNDELRTKTPCEKVGLQRKTPWLTVQEPWNDATTEKQEHKNWGIEPGNGVEQEFGRGKNQKK